MYLIARQAQLQGADATEWATTILGRVREVTDHDVSLWTRVLSENVNAVSWTSWWDDLGVMEAAFMTLATDEKYLALVKEAGDFVVGPAHDRLYQAVHGDPTAGANSQYVSVVSAVAASGNFARAFTSGIEIAQKAEQGGGHAVTFTRNITGPYSGVAWLTGYESLSDFQSSTEKLSADPSWVELVDGTDGAFVGDGLSTQSSIYLKLA